MELSDFDFELPEELIAQHPSEKRDESRLMVLHKNTGVIEHKHFYDIIDYLEPGDVLVRNNSKVIPARLYGTKEETGAHVEVLILKMDGDICECLCGNAKVIKKDTVITFSDKLRGRCLEVKEEGIRVIQFLCDGIFLEVLNEVGLMPLPPYIHEKLKEKDRYQNVYSKPLGSAACPTAGLHFTEELLNKIKEKGVEIRLYNIIYKLQEDIENAVKGMLDPVYEEKESGQAEVRETFKVSKVGTIAGCYVLSGSFVRNGGVRVVRDSIVVYTGKIGSLKRFKDDVKEVKAGYECGITIENFNDIKVGDILECFVMEEKERE